MFVSVSNDWLLTWYFCKKVTTVYNAYKDDIRKLADYHKRWYYLCRTSPKCYCTATL